MTDGTKIALGIVAASLVLAATYACYREYDRSRSIAELREVIGDCPATGYSSPPGFNQHFVTQKKRSPRISTGAEGRPPGQDRSCG